MRARVLKWERRKLAEDSGFRMTASVLRPVAKKPIQSHDILYKKNSGRRGSFRERIDERFEAGLRNYAFVVVAQERL